MAEVKQYKNVHRYMYFYCYSIPIKGKIFLLLSRKKTEIT